VHTNARFTWPANFPRTRFKFGCQERLLLLLAWLTLLPMERPLPQMVQILAILVSNPFNNLRR
jgi:hypothetical protein